MKRKLLLEDDPEVRVKRRLTPFTNTPKQKKEERRRVLFISKRKLHQIDEPEDHLLKYVLLRNTVNTLRDSKYGYSGYESKSECDPIKNSYLYKNSHLFVDTFNYEDEVKHNVTMDTTEFEPTLESLDTKTDPNRDMDHSDKDDIDRTKSDKEIVADICESLKIPKLLEDDIDDHPVVETRDVGTSSPDELKDNRELFPDTDGINIISDSLSRKCSNSASVNHKDTNSNREPMDTIIDAFTLIGSTSSFTVSRETSQDATSTSAQNETSKGVSFTTSLTTHTVPSDDCDDVFPIQDIFPVSDSSSFSKSPCRAGSLWDDVDSIFNSLITV